MKELLWKEKWKFIRYLFASFLFIVDHVVQILAFSVILGAIQNGRKTDIKRLVLLAVIVSVFACVNFIVSRMLRIGYMRDIILKVRKQAFQKIINMSYKNFSKQSKEVYLSHLINDVNSFEENYFLSLLNFLIDVGMFIISCIWLFVLQKRLAFYMILISIAIYFISLFFSKKTVQLQEKVSSENEVFTGNISNTFQGLEIIKLNRIDEKFLQKSLDGLRKLEFTKYLFNIFALCQKNFINVLGYVVSCFVMVYICVYFDQGLNLATASIVFQLASGMAFNLIEAFPSLNKMKAAAKIYEKITKSEDDTINETEGGRKEFVFEKEIKAEHLSFSFEGNEIFTDVSFVIEKGKKYLIKGVSGAGKTTLINLLSKTIDGYTGKLMVDGIDYKEISEKSLTGLVSFIYQNVFLFEDSIKNNITLYKEISEQRVREAIKACDLKELVESFPEKENKILEENGKNLSGGQRQRISIARAIARDSEILFVDEGTSGLNKELGSEIEQVFLSLKQTVLSISHRYYEGVTENYDYVLEIKNGKINQFIAKDYFKEAVTC